MKWFLSNFEFRCRWYKNEDPKLIELSLLHFMKGDALYILFFQVWKLTINFSFNIYEYGRGLEGIPT